MNNVELTAPEHRRVIGRPFQPGQSGNPLGRPRGARSKLGEAFLEDLRADWLEGGAEALARCRKTDPAAYLRVVASLMPREAITLHAVGAVDVATFAESFRAAVAMLGNDAPDEPE